MPRDAQEVGTTVIPGHPDAADVIRRSREACAALSDDHDGLKRDILGHAGNRWSLGVVYALGVKSPLRHAELSRHLDGVTQRMLTRTLRQLERDGLISRRDFREVPPKVEYALSEAGMGLLLRMMPLWTWVIDNADTFAEARKRFDKQTGASATP